MAIFSSPTLDSLNPLHLPMIAQAIDGYRPASDDLYASLLEAKTKPHVMDDATLDRVEQVYGEQRDDMWLYDEQLRRWSEGSLTSDQTREIDRVLSQRVAERFSFHSVLLPHKSSQDRSLSRLTSST